jgi:cysteine-rich repeat protein
MRLVSVGALAALAAALAVAGGALSAGSSASRSTITACVQKKSGAARLVSSGTRCRAGERKVTWKRIGPVGKTGTPGSPGAAGAQGAQGAQGPPGIDDFNDVDGMPCTRDDGPGTIELVYGSGHVARPRCVRPGDGPVCGDGIQEGGEACDDGNTNPTDDCTNSCADFTCGDGVTHTTGPNPEQCDAGTTTAICDSDCTTAYCGDGTTNSARGEQCDNNGGGYSNICDNDCTTPSCGDGNVNPAVEECDDANPTPGDGCDQFCKIEP